MTALIMYDSVDWWKIPHRAKAVAGYIDGRYISYPQLQQHFGKHAHCLSITVRGGVADCLDVEPGNPVMPAQAGAWVRSMIRHGVWRPCVYAPASEMPAVERSLRGIPRNQYRLWIADWPGDGAKVPVGYDAHQYLNHGRYGENYDISVCRLDFFSPVITPPKKHHRLLPRKPHPKVTAATAASALVTAILAALSNYNIHVQVGPSVIAAITGALAAFAGYLKRSR